MNNSALLIAPPRLLHPAFDVGDDVMGLGFRVPNRKGKDGLLHIVSAAGRVASGLKERVKVGNRTVQFRPVESTIARLDDQWDRDDLSQFLSSPSSLTGPKLYDRMQATWRRHVYFDHPGEYVITACWCLMTYVYPIFSSVPFLHLLGDKGTGKSQALDLLQQLSRDGQKVRLTPAAVGDATEARRPTLLVDQVDNLSRELEDLLADSYRRGARRMLVVIDNKGRRLGEYETFGPKALAGIESLPDDLRDRAIVVRTTKAPMRLAAILPEDPDLRRLRAESYRWVMLNGFKLADLRDMLIDGAESPLIAQEWSVLGQYHGRRHDLWLPIEVVMEALQIPLADREAAREYYSQSQVVTTAEPPRDRIELVQVLYQLSGTSRKGSAPKFIVARSEIEELLTDEDSESSPHWNHIKIGKQICALVGVVKSKARSTDRGDMVYEIDWDALRVLAERYGLTK